MLCLVEQRKPKLVPLPPPLPPEMSFAIWCFLIGESDIFKVKIDPTDDVADLKQKIKGQKQALKEIDADHLTLHRVTINRPLETEALINELERLSETPQECTPLNLAIDVLSADIYNNPPTGKMHIILVRTPEGESIYYGGVLLMADGVGTPFEQL